MKTFREFISTCEGYVPLRTSGSVANNRPVPQRRGSGSLQGIRATPKAESPAGLNFKPSYGRRFGISSIGLAD